MPSTDSFTSTAAIVTSTTAVVTHVVMGADDVGHVQYSPLGWRVSTYQGNVQVTKAATFGGSQSAPTFPVTLAAAQDLLTALQNVDT